MKIPLTKYGWPQVVVFPAIQIAVMVIALMAWPKSISEWGIIFIEIILAVVLVWTLCFFRDPKRIVPADKNLLLAPADGKITDMEIVEGNDFIAEPALRIGIFLSIFDTHINRAPCNVRVEKITYRKGSYKNAMNPNSTNSNESNDLHLVKSDSPRDRLVVRQISGAIARRIVCAIGQGEELISGEKFGMIKFGSRTELYLPVRKNANCTVRIGDKVKAGQTVLIRYD